MLPIANENNHSAVVRGSTNKDIETSIATENMRGNDVTKTTSETPTPGKHTRENIPTIWIRYLKKISQIIVWEDKEQKKV